MKIKASITGISGYIPEYVLTNFELEKIINTNNEWIINRTGIKERRILKKKKKNKKKKKRKKKKKKKNKKKNK